jgi:hypothetical protein
MASKKASFAIINALVNIPLSRNDMVDFLATGILSVVCKPNKTAGFTAAHSSLLTNVRSLLEDGDLDLRKAPDDLLLAFAHLVSGENYESRSGVETLNDLLYRASCGGDEATLPPLMNVRLLKYFATEEFSAWATPLVDGILVADEERIQRNKAAEVQDAINLLKSNGYDVVLGKNDPMRKTIDAAKKAGKIAK